MARGVSLVSNWLKSNGGTAFLFGTNDDDYINVKYDMNSARFSATEIQLNDGNDSLWIGRRMNGYGKNTIKGGSGNKNIAVNEGLDANCGAENVIDLGGQSGDRHNLTFGYVTSANGGQNKIVTQEGLDSLAFTHAMRAHNRGINSIDLGDGEKNLTFRYDVNAYGGGANSINLGVGSHSITIGTQLGAYYLGQSDITTVSGDTVLNIKNAMYSDGTNNIHLGFGNHDITIGNIFAAGNGYNSIKTDGTTNLTVNNDVVSYRTNEILTGEGNDKIWIKGGLKAISGDNIIDTGAGNDTITIDKALRAASGDNRITTGDGDDQIFINGSVTSGARNTSYLHTGDGNDTISIDASVGKYALTIDAGAGYDVLNLHANNYCEFSARYKNWMTGVAQNNGLGLTGLEQINVGIDRAHGLNQIDWLTKIVNDYNSDNSSDQIHMGINLDTWGAAGRLSDIFTSANESAIDFISLTGKNANTLAIHSSLASNGYDNATLHINGDANDTVAFDHLWTLSGANVVDQDTGIAYNIYHNSYNEDVFVQAGVNVITV
ncbi:hypothetical protein [Bartonella sp. HY038]|uniref:hypothetical protein n=1 Tax=Bartonella sp. HY038 TaxID=2759660 RepID=UPI0015FAD8FA|nr:hypothetical protein [Bartonella sp. HY038]